MNCPKCRTVSLSPVKLERGLSAMGCPSCGGAVVSLLSYRDWLELFAPQAPDGGHGLSGREPVDGQETHIALNCPKCKRLMVKYRIAVDMESRLDFCVNCDEVWLDAGEWELLKAMELERRMPMVLTEVWQRRVREQEREDNLDQRLMKFVSRADLVKARKVRQWLQDHPNKSEILLYIRHD